MSYIQFESSRDKEKARAELRHARSSVLEKAESDAKRRKDHNEKARERGEGTWMLPSINDKIELQSSQHKSKKRHKDKKKKHKKDKKRRKLSLSTDDESAAVTAKDSNKPDVADLEKTQPVRDDWMTLPGLLSTYSRSDTKRERVQENDTKKQLDAYKPGESARELNPYWKDGGTGLPSLNTTPSYRKPDHEETNSSSSRYQKPSNEEYANTYQRSGKSSWMKNDKETDRGKSQQSTHKRDRPYPSKHGEESKQQERRLSLSCDSSSESDDHPEKPPTILTDQQMNELAAKLVKAEILGNTSLIEELKIKLDAARDYRKSQAQILVTSTSNEQENNVVLTHTDSRGVTRPLAIPKKENDPYYGKKKKQRKTDTHSEGSRVRYYADDDKYSLKEMFEREKLNTTDEQNKQFAEIVAKHTNPNDNLEDIFAEKIQHGKSELRTDEQTRSKAIAQHEKLSRVLEQCDKCLESKCMEKHLIVAMGEKVYIRLMSHEGLFKGHCLIVPMQHVSCSTMLDEEVWAEIQVFCKALTRMFQSRSLDVVFFESAIFLNRSPHMVVQCVPGTEADYELAPMYFKKAILECEGEWSHNKKLINLKGRNVRKSIPKGLPYFWVDFGGDIGFAHVVEDQDRFPKHFAQEIIGGLLGLEPRMWRHPNKLQQPIQKVTEFAEWWKPFDITTTK